jgi:hypothetical protein
MHFSQSEEDPHPSVSSQMSGCLFYLYDGLETQTGCAMMNTDTDPCCAIVDCRHHHHPALLCSLCRGSYIPAVFASASAGCPNLDHQDEQNDNDFREDNRLLKAHHRH